MMIRIGACSYHAVSIPPGELGTVAYRMKKLARPAATYDLLLDEYGQLRCDCPNYVMEHENMGTVCKHGRALRAAGLVN